MSTLGVSLSSVLSQGLQNWQTKTQKVQSEFQQLGQDLQAGNLTQAQSDFSALSQNLPSSVQSNSSISQAFTALGSALQSGNVTAAQQAYTTVQQDVQQAAQSSGHHHHHHHYGQGSPSTTQSSTQSSIAQEFGSLGAALQAGNLSAAQTAYSTLQQEFQQLGWNVGTAPTAPQATSTVNVQG